MIAKQTLVSASLLLFVAPGGFARAEPGEPPEHPDEAALEDPIPEAPPPRPGKTGRFMIGAGFRTDDGFIASARVEQLDLFRTGWQLALDAKISARQQQFAIGLGDPTLFGSSVALGINAYTERRVLPGFARDATGASLTLSKELAPHVRGFVGYRIEDVNAVPNVTVAARGDVGGAQPYFGLRIATLRAGLEYNTLDAPEMPRHGTRIGTSIEISDRDFGSQIQMIRTDAWMNHHRPLGPLTLHLGGTLSTVSNGAPYSERLHLDGSSDIRGYAPGSLGPRDLLTGASLGGTLKYTARGELEVPLIPRAGISAVGFLDAGGIFADSGQWNGASAGVGLLWRSPIGVIRLDYAVPLDGGRPGFVFGIGGTW
jgi:outer membrane protein insertion porin family